MKYWNVDWQKIITENDESYQKKILDAGFDGVYLDIIDAFEHFKKGRAQISQICLLLTSLRQIWLNFDPASG
nr:hypothetical protein [uncultured Campylobacter sp.]